MKLIRDFTNILTGLNAFNNHADQTGGLQGALTAAGEDQAGVRSITRSDAHLKFNGRLCLEIDYTPYT